MADDDFPEDDVDFDEELVEEDLEPEDLDEALVDDEEGFGDDLDDDTLLEEDEEAPPVGKTARSKESEDEDDDEDLVDPDDVEADLDTILKDRLVAADDEPEDDEEEAEVDERGEPGDRLQPKRPDEQLCTRCFLLVRRGAPACPMGDDDCPLFT